MPNAKYQEPQPSASQGARGPRWPHSDQVATAAEEPSQIIRLEGSPLSDAALPQLRRVIEVAGPLKIQAGDEVLFIWNDSRLGVGDHVDRVRMTQPLEVKEGSFARFRFRNDPPLSADEVTTKAIREQKVRIIKGKPI